MSNKYVAFCGALGLVWAVVACHNDSRADNEFCALSPDGALVSSTDGVNFTHLNDQIGDDNPDAASFVEGEAGWGGGPICTTRDGEIYMPMKDFPHGGVVKPREPEFGM